jgi:carbamoylphosphate synthase large subunit
MRIMMSAAASPVAPGIIRHLQSLGHYVIGHDCMPYGNGIADEFHVSPLATDPEYLDFIMSKDPDIYLPFLDEELRAFGKIAWRCSSWSPHETIKIFTSKLKQQSAFERARLPVAPRSDGGPSYAKPDHGRGGKGIIKIDSWPLYDGVQEDGNFLVQKAIDGDEYTVDVLTGLDGKFLFAVPRLRIRANGVSVIGKVVMDLPIINLAREIVGSFHFAGPINIQMVREAGTKKLYIIELNPRLSGSCMFTVMAGWDIISAAIKVWHGLPFEPPDRVDDVTIKRTYVEEYVS